MPHTPKHNPYRVNSVQDANKYMHDLVQSILVPAQNNNVKLNNQQSLENAIDKVVSYESEGSREVLDNLLTMTAFMENSMGHDLNAYGRTYTASPMSIDNDAFQTLFQQKSDTRDKYKVRYNELGLPSDAFGLNMLLKQDDPLASVAVARQVYGLSPAPLPENTPMGLYNYYKDYYNRKGMKKHQDDNTSYKRFMQGYNKYVR
jgi:hypothetical protein